jgi:hypothetical protein
LLAATGEANSRASLTIYRKLLETVSDVSRCVRDGDCHGRPVRSDCRSHAGGWNSRGCRAAESAVKASSATVRPARSRAARIGRPGVRPVSGAKSIRAGARQEARRQSDRLPLRRSDRRAAGAIRTNSSLPRSGGEEFELTSPARSAAWRGSPESRRRRPPRTPTSRRDATCWCRPSAAAATGAGR